MKSHSSMLTCSKRSERQVSEMRLGTYRPLDVPRVLRRCWTSEVPISLVERYTVESVGAHRPLARTVCSVCREQAYISAPKVPSNMAPYVLSNAGMGGKRENGSTGGVDVVVLGEDIAVYLGLGGRAETGDL